MKTLCNICLVILLSSLISCTEKVVRQTVLSQDSIPTQNFEISLDRDTVLKTSAGALLNIPKGTFVSDSRKTIVLDVKEAYDPEAMLRGGLTTKSKNGLLSSGGMIYVGSKDSTAYRVEGKIKISIPTPVVNPVMSVFKGKVEEDGTISWEEQTALQNPEDTLYVKGEKLFKNGCNSCHAIGKNKVGPDLAYIGERRDKKWLYSYTRNSQALIRGVFTESDSSSDPDPYAMCLYIAYSRTEMTAFPYKDDELKALYYFVDQFSHRNKITYPDDSLYRNMDSCKLYFEVLNKRNALVNKNGKHEWKNVPKTITHERPSAPLPEINNGPSGINIRENVRTYEDQPEYYKIEINTFGWYNIDVLIKYFSDVETCNLQVTLNDKVEKSKVYCIVPDYNFMQVGGFMKDGKTIAFDAIDGSAPLPVGKTAHIISIRESSEGIWFAIHSFKIKKKDRINLVPVLMSADSVMNKIKQLKLKEFNLKIKETTYAKEIRKLDLELKELKSLLPKNFDCDCGYSRAM